MNLTDETFDMIVSFSQVIKYYNQVENTPEDILKAALGYWLSRFYDSTVIESKDLSKILPLANTEYPLKNKIGELVNKRGITLSRLAEQLKMSKGTLSNIVNNRHQPSLEIFIKIWLTLGCPSLHEILYREFPE